MKKNNYKNSFNLIEKQLGQYKIIIIPDYLIHLYQILQLKKSLNIYVNPLNKITSKLQKIKST